MDRMTVKDWEKEQGIMFTGDDVDLDKELNGSEFREMVAEGHHVAVDHAGRAQWLKDNGHEVTRENMLNEDLEPGTPAEEAKSEEESADQADSKSKPHSKSEERRLDAGKQQA